MERAEPPKDDARNSGSLEARLRDDITGDVRFDPLYRTIYATDAGIHEIVPAGVVLPKTVADVVATVRACRGHGTPVIPRGAGTGLAGGAVGSGVQLDLSRHMRRMGPLDPAAHTIDVEPGVVLDELNRHLAPQGLQFPPDVATANRATIGGMIANNSCGAHSIRYGRTVDHVRGLTVVLGDGRIASFGEGSFVADADAACAGVIEDGLAQIRDAHHDEIVQRFPKVLRSNGGYGLDRLGPVGAACDGCKILCGSEGTLGIVVGAKLNLVPRPQHTGLVLLLYNDLLEALAPTPAILEHKPAAVELIDQLILDAARQGALGSRCADLLTGEPAALLLVEFYDDSADSLASRMRTFTSDKTASGAAYAAISLLDTTRQADVWNLRKSGLGLLMSKPGDAQPYAFIEDTAVDPARLRDYIEAVGDILKSESIRAGYYAHAGAGCIHVRPILNLKTSDGVERMGRIAEAIADLALRFGGAITGEHGDGMVRSCWLERTYGPRITAAFGQVKTLFDPDGVLNPHKIVDPGPMTRHLRYGAGYRSVATKTYLDFSTHGGMAGLAGMCSGVGECRKRDTGTMCPSFIATDDEEHTTRARANALRVALSNRGLLDGLSDPHLAEVMDLCLSCKACKTECPTGVDMARLKSEYLAQRHLAVGASDRERLIADMPRLLARASRWPRLSNAVARSTLVRAWAERRYGFDRRVAPPKLALQTFRTWYRRHRASRADAPAPRGRILYFLDTWTNYCRPQVGVAAVTLLERAGFDVICPPTGCCGRTAISQGLLADARDLAASNVRLLSRIIGPAVAIVGTEPSCVLTLVDEYPQLLRSSAARHVARKTMMIETFLSRLLERDPTALSFVEPKTPLCYHGHCHQKAMVTTADARALLHRVWGEAAQEIDRGCCGMAGAFGHEVEHYDVARAIGAARLFPAVRDRGEADIAVSGFSCLTQIEHHTGAPVRHLVEYLSEALEP